MAHDAGWAGVLMPFPGFSASGPNLSPSTVHPAQKVPIVTSSALVSAMAPLGLTDAP